MVCVWPAWCTHAHRAPRVLQQQAKMDRTRKRLRTNSVLELDDQVGNSCELRRSSKCCWCCQSGRGRPRRGAENSNAMGNLFSGGGGSKKPQPAAAKPVAILEKDQAILVRILQTSPLGQPFDGILANVDQHACIQITHRHNPVCPALPTPCALRSQPRVPCAPNHGSFFRVTVQKLKTQRDKLKKLQKKVTCD
jgi:hypothetical protein